MAFYLVRAHPKRDRIGELQTRLENREIEDMRPFGKALTRALENVRFKTETREALWEEDYCRPTLAQERAALLDDYLQNLEIERVYENMGWEQIDSPPSLWTEIT